MLLTVQPMQTGVTPEVLGLVPQIIANAVSASKELNDFMPNIEKFYGFPTYEMQGTVDSDGVYHYPGDPDLQPLAKFIIPSLDLVGYQYDYGIVAFVSKDYTTVIRMD